MYTLCSVVGVSLGHNDQTIFVRRRNRLHHRAQRKCEAIALQQAVVEFRYSFAAWHSSRNLVESPNAYFSSAARSGFISATGNTQPRTRSDTRRRVRVSDNGVVVEREISTCEFNQSTSMICATCSLYSAYLWYTCHAYYTLLLQSYFAAINSDHHYKNVAGASLAPRFTAVRNFYECAVRGLARAGGLFV